MGSEIDEYGYGLDLGDGDLVGECSLLAVFEGFLFDEEVGRDVINFDIIGRVVNTLPSSWYVHKVIIRKYEKTQGPHICALWDATGDTLAGGD